MHVLTKHISAIALICLGVLYIIPSAMADGITADAGQLLYVNQSNVRNFPVSGSCSRNGVSILINRAGGVNIATSTCSGGRWSAAIDVSYAAEGAFDLRFRYSDQETTTALVQTYQKNTRGAPAGGAAPMPRN